MIRITTMLILGLMLMPLAGVCAPQRNTRAILDDAHKIKDERKALEAYAELASAPIETSEDVQNLYEESRNLEKQYAGRRRMPRWGCGRKRS